MASANGSIRTNEVRTAPQIEVRNVTACMACRRRKIKCHMLNAEPPCTRCRARNLVCTVNQKRNDSEDTSDWQGKMERRLTAVESTLLQLQSEAEKLDVIATEARTCPFDSTDVLSISAQSRPKATTDMSSDLTCSLGAFPASSVHGLAQDSPVKQRSSREPACPSTITVSPDDLLLAADAARAHFQYFQTRLNPLIFGVLNNGDSIQTVSKRSPFLALTLCATAAYCTNALDYSTWRNRLRDLIVQKTFDTFHTFDEVRAVCVGAFWLDEMATTLNTLAVRMAAELNLHRCITKMPHKKQECYERTRLYFLVCVVDHRCSIAFGRPPLTRGIKHDISPRQLLQCEFSQDQRNDLQLVSDFELWAITASVFDNFGADIERHSSVFREDMTIFDRKYDEWLQAWSPVVSPLSHLLEPSVTTSLTGQIFHLSLLAAKLFLYSHVFRGPGQRQNRPSTNFDRPTELQGFAVRSIEIAGEYLRLIVKLIDQDSFIDVLPSYFSLMTAHACMVIHRTSRLSQTSFKCLERPQSFMEDLLRLYQALEVALHPANTSGAIRTQTGKPLIRLARILGRLLSDKDNGQDAAMAADQHSQDNDLQLTIGHAHSHSPNFFLDYSLSSTDFAGTDFTFFDSDVVDWP